MRTLLSQPVLHTLLKHLACAALVLAPCSALADPQVHAGVTVGGGARDLRDDVRGVFHLGATADVLLFRRKQTDIGFGPYVQLATASFQTFESGVGASLLLPTGGPVFLLSAAPHLRVGARLSDPLRPLDASAVDLGATATLFFGSRSYNFHSVYSYQLGVFIEGRQGFTSRQTEIYGGVHVDLAVLAMPVVFLVQSLRK